MTYIYIYIYICFINTIARLFCDARPRLHVIRNDIEKLDVGSSHLLLQVQNRPTSLVYLGNSVSCYSLFLSMAFDLVFARSTCKHRLCTSAYIKHDLFNVITHYVKSGRRIAEQASLFVYKAYTFI